LSANSQRMFFADIPSKTGRFLNSLALGIGIATAVPTRLRIGMSRYAEQLNKKTYEEN